MSYLIHLEAVIPPLPNGVQHISTDWEVATDSTFTNIVASSYNDTTNLATWFTIVNNNPPLYGRSRITTSIGTIDWSEPQLCLTDIERPDVIVVGEPDDIPIDPILRTTPFISTVAGDNHISTDWIIVDLNGVIIWSSIGDTSNLTTIQIPPGYLTPGDTYKVNVRYNGSSGQSSPYSVKQFTISQVTVEIPNIAIQGYPTNINSHPQITTSAFVSSDPTDIHVATDWIVEDINGSIVFQSINNTINLTSITLPYGTLDPNTTYIVKVQYIGQYSNSNYGVQTFITVNIIVDTPSAIIQGEPSNISTGPLITGSVFTMLNGIDSHYSTDWVIKDSSNNVVWQSLFDTNNLTTITVPLGTLNQNQSYTLEVRYHGNIMSSPWYQKAFTTANITIAAPTITVQGEPNNVPQSGPQITTSAFTVLTGTDIHAATDWIIEDISNNIVWQSLADTTNLTSIIVPAGYLSSNTDYVVKVRHIGAVSASVYTTKNIRTSSVTIATPSLTVQGAPNNVPTGPQLTGSAFTVISGTDTHLATDWIIEDTSNNVVWQSLNDTVSLTSIVVPNNTLSNSTTYVFKVIYKGASGASSSPGTVTATTVSSTVSGNPGNVYSTTLPVIQDPTITVQGAPNNVPTGPQLTGSAFTVISGTDTHLMTDWIIKDNTTGNVIWSSIGDTVNLTNITLPTGTLAYNTGYMLLVKYYGNVSESNWVSNTFTTTSAPIPVDTWNAKAPYVTVIENHSQSTLSDGRVLVVGGFDGTLTTNASNIYDPTTDTWTAVTNYPFAVSRQSQSTLSDGRVLVVGGRDNTSTNVNTCNIYDPATDTWTPAANYPITINYHTQSTLPDGRVLVVGGHDGVNIVNTCYIYDPATDTWTAVANYPITVYNHTQSTLSDGRVLVVGGLDTITNIVNTCNIYDPATDTWTPVANYPITVYNHAQSTLLDGRVLISNGWDGTVYTNAVYIYEPASDTFTQVANYPIGISLHTQSTLNDGRVLVVGGFDGNVYVNNVNLYIP